MLLSDLERYSTSVIIVTGIANPRPLFEKIRTYGIKVLMLQYADHHDYTRKDLKDIQKKYNSVGGENKIIITTEKDAVKLGRLKYIEPALKENIYYLPIKVKFIDDRQEEFNKYIIDYVKSYQ
jgi:tetraacyldisaccharide 4'-kinase